MEKRYLQLLSREFPTEEAAAGEIVNLSAMRSLPKGTEYFFSDLHGEYDAFSGLLRSASGVIREKIDAVFGKSVSVRDRDELASLIYRPEAFIKARATDGVLTDEWRRLTLYRLILVSQAVGAKYTRQAVREKMPEGYAYILDELLNVTDDINRDFYYDEITASILETGVADSFITAMCTLIRRLTVDWLHIIGDIYDRGPRADRIMDELVAHARVDIQWGNHDISWMGAAAGCPALVANVIRIALSYNSYDVLEDGYGLNLRPLSVFATEVYGDDPCRRFLPHTLDDVVFDHVDALLTARMHKAIAVIQCKLEGQLLRDHPEYGMDDRRVLERCDFRRGVVELGGKEYALSDTHFPTVNPDDPLSLTDGERELMAVLLSSFHHSTRLNEHIRFLYTHGGMYKVANGNLLYHGCIPVNDDGSFRTVRVPFAREEKQGKELLDAIERVVRRAYFLPYNTPEQIESRDYVWYLWCGPDSPLYGKDKMAFFERTFVCGAPCTENYGAYYRITEHGGAGMAADGPSMTADGPSMTADGPGMAVDCPGMAVDCPNGARRLCDRILTAFGLDPEKGHIINGHVPVLLKEGQSPVRAGGRLFVIDGGISKAYRSKTGIAGYTLIYNSHSICLAEHCAPNTEYPDGEIRVHVAEKMEHRVNIADTDLGRELSARIEDLQALLAAYRSGETM